MVQRTTVMEVERLKGEKKEEGEDERLTRRERGSWRQEGNKRERKRKW